MSLIPNADYDGAWKEILNRYLPEVIVLLFPEVARVIDWSKPIRYLNKELQKISYNAATGKKFVDVLIQVHQKNGSKALLLIHIEVQCQFDADLPERTFVYNTLISLQYPEPVVSLVILADDHPDWKPTSYERDALGCKTHFQFHACKLLDLAKHWDEMKEHANPAIIVIMAHVRALETYGDMQLRLEHKWELLRRVYAQGWRRREILAMYRILDWLLQLPPPETLIFEERVITYEKEQAMEYITSMELRGIQKGREEGREEGECQVLTRILTKRFPQLEVGTLTAQLQSLQVAHRGELAEQLFEFRSVEEFQTWLQRSLQ